MTVRDVSELLYPAVQEAIASLGLLGSDAAAVKLAQQYARAIDAATDAKRPYILRWLGPELLKVLVELGATPAGRKNLEKGEKTEKTPENGLQRLRSAK